MQSAERCAQHQSPWGLSCRRTNHTHRRQRARSAHRADSDKALAFLARLAAEFTAVLNLPDLLEHVIRVLNEEIGFDSAAVSLLEKHDGDEVLIVRAGSGLRGNAVGMKFPRGAGLVWKIMETAKPVRIADLHADPRLVRKDLNVRSGIYAPLMVHGHPIGVLSAYRDTVGAFKDADLNLLTVVARYLAGACEVARLHEQLRDLAATDSLTGLANRRAFLDRIGGELERSRRARRPLSIALLDLNTFKVVNDAYGHFVGDEVLIRIAQALAQKIRPSDLAARYGGDEFILMLSETTGLEAVDRLTHFGPIEVALPNHARPDPLSFSWGVASFPEDGENPNRLLQVADGRLYLMKQRLHSHSPRRSSGT